jgi:hypothetical protein
MSRRTDKSPGDAGRGDTKMTTTTKTYSICDSNSGDSGLTFCESVERIAEWYEDADSWANGESDEAMNAAIREAIDSVEQPESGDVATLQDYADSICDAVAVAMGGEPFYGHGNYYVSAADRIGVALRVEEEAEDEDDE